MKLKIRAFRTALNMTQAQFAKFVDVPQQTISSLEVGAREPFLRSALKIAKALGCTVEELVEDAERAS